MPGLSGSQKAYKQARSGIERCDTTRTNYYTPNTVVLINSVDVTSYVSFNNPSPTYTLQMNAQPNTARFTVLPGGPTVVAGQSVVIALGQAANAEFAGQAQVPTIRLEPSTTGIGYQVFQDVDVIDARRLMDRRIVNKEYVGWSASDIAIDLIGNHTSGFSYFSVALGLPTIDSFIVSNETVTSALTRLVNLIDGGWFVDSMKVAGAFNVHLFLHRGGEVGPRAGTAPVTLTDGLWSLLGNPSFTLANDISQQRTRAIIEGKSTTCPVAIPGGTATVTTGGSVAVDYAVVAGGGGGGPDDGGGGGGGGLLTGTDVIPAAAYAVVVGAGGAGGAYVIGVPANGSNGGVSSFNGHSAAGGGGGGGTGLTGSAGGSGGGGSWFTSAVGGAGTTGQGFAGGQGHGGGAPGFVGGAGGGAGGVGGNGGDHGSGIGGFGGVGVQLNISGAVMPYAGGGGAGGNGGGTGGDGATVTGGNGGSDSDGEIGSAGVVNTGGGGGGAKSATNGNAGGSGIVIISYVTGTLTATGGTITTSGSRTIHTFTSDGTFTISAVTSVTPAALVTDLPLTDNSQIAQVTSGTQTVRISNQVVTYSSIGGPVVAAGTNPPGSTASSDIAAGAASIPLVDSSQFTASPGWAQVGSQYVRFTGIGGGALTGIPSAGLGALALAVKSGTQVTWLGQINLSPSVIFDPPVLAGAQVTQRTIIDNTTAQAAQAAIEGGDGIHEYVVPGTATTIGGATTRGTAEVTDFGYQISTAQWSTLDLNARPGRLAAISLSGVPAIGLPDTTLVIMRVMVKLIAPNYLPERVVEASSVQMLSLLDAVVAVPPPK